MHVRFSRRTDYAIRAALELARRDGLVKRREIAAATQAPTSVVAQALADLVRAGVAVGVAGPRGGYRLAASPAAISVLDVVRGVERPVSEPRCVLHERACSHVGSCPFHETMHAAEAAFLARLAEEDLATVAARIRPVEPQPPVETVA